jgi:dipeptidyl aminopeptidase/acylaminoacyl peptidase
VGLIGFSYGAGPTLVAATDPAIARQVCFVISVGGYYDLVEVIRFLTTGHFEWQGHRGHLPPSPHGRGRFLLANLDLLRDAKDRQILAAAADPADGGWTEAAVPTAELTPWGAALHALLTNTDPKRVGDLIAQLDPQVRERIAFLSPSRVIGRLHSHLVIVHGVQDDFIPYTESLRLAAAAPSADRVHLAITRLLNHVDPTGPRLDARTFLRGYLRDLWQIARVVNFVVAQRR